MLNYNLPIKKSKRRKAKAWLSLIRDYEQSGQSMKEFCEAHQINSVSLKNWKYKFKRQQREAVVVNNVTSFAPVRISNELKPIGDSAIKIELRSNVKIIVPNNFDEQQLLRLVNLLQ
jgi:transposase-like protein